MMMEGPVNEMERPAPKKPCSDGSGNGNQLHMAIL